MTNQLFRDYLDNRIPGHETPRLAFVHLEINTESFTERMGQAAAATNGALQTMGDAFQHFAETFALSTWQLKVLSDYWDTPPTPPPSDPRERALWNRDHQNHGPKPEPLHKRGRITKYRTKG